MGNPLTPFVTCNTLTWQWVYSKLVQKQVAVWSLLAFDAVLMATLFTIAWVTLPLPRRPRAQSLAKTGLVFAFILASLAPVLRTLTASFSTDTVWALTIALSGFAIVSHDFSVVQPGAVLRVRGTTSLNAAMFASVLVTSRLQSAADVFAFETLCMLMFGLVPIVRGCIQVRIMDMVPHVGVATPHLRVVLGCRCTP